MPSTRETFRSLGGGTLWLAANSRIDKTALLPFRPYCRSDTQTPTQVLLERFEEGPPLTPLTTNQSTT